MTCIVALVSSDDTIYMGADSCASNSSSFMIVRNPKVFVLGERFIIGACGSFRSIDLLQYSLKVPKQATGISDDEFMRTTFITSVREMFIKNGFKHEDESLNFIVGYEGNIYSVEEDFSIINPAKWGHSIGSGGESARGSLWTTREMDCTPEWRIMMALQTSEALTPSVRAPFVMKELSKRKRKPPVARVVS
jgi:hypothetical protein